ncbi:cyclin-dependent kinase 2-interacting protein-like [Mizuhopecten yessoensis]|uniref:Cyclin-dependent kinase 2-interacting protein n=1 Tax=Mizuhopecten yessoensis TaxID=6573 RepID=A0A210QWN3_MIZYE|nr:cyclin-dependent kinase 2-interacting protein-like [Mizuhopecten yessoensis]OWF53131.1 Cyclin-dependent kinase 2-interacting protein [Mizuhopecten yessoensis]
MQKTTFTDGSEERFSPVKTNGSPVSFQRTSSLTGSHRKVKDTAADLHNLCQKWLKFNTEGTASINEIANVKLQAIFKEEESQRSEEEGTLIKAEMPEVLEDHCNKVLHIVDKMRKLVDKMEAMAEIFRGVADLVRHKAQCSSTDCNPILFQTWKVKDFEEATLEMLESYRREIKLKELLSKNICHVKDRDCMMFYTAAWLHQPYIDSSCILLLESMLTETGHR